MASIATLSGLLDAAPARSWGASFPVPSPLSLASLLSLAVPAPALDATYQPRSRRYRKIGPRSCSCRSSKSSRRLVRQTGDSSGLLYEAKAFFLDLVAPLPHSRSEPPGMARRSASRTVRIVSSTDSPWRSSDAVALSIRSLTSPGAAPARSSSTSIGARYSRSPRRRRRSRACLLAVVADGGAASTPSSAASTSPI